VSVTLGHCYSAEQTILKQVAGMQEGMAEMPQKRKFKEEIKQAKEINK
jgi:hypothetical protein